MTKAQTLTKIAYLCYNDFVKNLSNLKDSYWHHASLNGGVIFGV